MKKWIKRILMVAIGIMTGSILHVTIFAATTIDTQPAYDLSQWQKPFTLQQVQALKQEASFVILRVQYGNTYRDTAFQNNLKLITQLKIPYGVYSYSMYESNVDAQNEATQLHQLAPQALFYVNDIEEDHVKNGGLNTATIAWGQRMHQLTKRPVILYSGLDFMNRKIGSAKQFYNALWIASYSTLEPNPTYHYDLWQYTDRKYSPALNQKVDASIIPSGGKPLSFWTNSGTKRQKTPRKIKVRPHQLKIKAASSHGVINHHHQKNYYYHDPRITQLKVIAKTGVSVYNRQHHQIMQCYTGNVIAVKYFRKLGSIYQAVTPNGNYFTANTKLVATVTNTK